MTRRTRSLGKEIDKRELLGLLLGCCIVSSHSYKITSRVRICDGHNGVEATSSVDFVGGLPILYALCLYYCSVYDRAVVVVVVVVGE